MQFYRISLLVRSLMTQMPAIVDDRTLSVARRSVLVVQLRIGFVLV